MKQDMAWLWEGARVAASRSPALASVMDMFRSSKHAPTVLLFTSPNGLMSELHVVRMKGEHESPIATYLRPDHEPGNPDMWIWHIHLYPKEISQNWVGTCFAFTLLYVHRMHTDPVLGYAYVMRERPRWADVYEHTLFETALLTLGPLTPSTLAINPANIRHASAKRTVLSCAHQEVMQVIGPPISAVEARHRMITINDVIGRFYLGLSL